MASFKCKICGGSLEIDGVQSVATCEYCGTKQTLPKLDDERRANLYDRANHFRRNNDFDKAMGIYESILNEDNTDAEAYWSLVLCRYGIEYVEDPLSHNRVPTVHRAQFTSIFDDDNYKLALENADSYQRIIYEGEAKAINEIQKGILAISQKEEPFDVFICYKETDNNGKRTPDSVLAQDLYYELTEQGFKVFFARITLEDKLGSAYEPYIFAALNSAKVMVALGTRPEFFDAVWVKNEWSRYLSLIKNGAKKTLIPAYRDMNPYDLPQEFSHLQAQDMSKLGFMQDLIRGINKIAEVEKKQAKATGESSATTTKSANPLLERAFIFIEDGDFQSGDEYCEKVLDKDPRCAEAYLGKLMIDLKVKKRRRLASVENSFEDNINYKRIIRFGSDELIEEVNEYLEEVKSAQLIKKESKAQEAQRLQAQKQELEAKAKEENDAFQRYEREKHLAEVTALYKSIPSKRQIKETVKREKSIKKLKTAAIIFLLLYWPVGLILFAVRAHKIKKAVDAENAKYNYIRGEYARLIATSRSDEVFELFVRKNDSQFFMWNPDVTMKIGKDTYKITKNSPLKLPLAPGRYSINFSAFFSTKHVDLNLTRNTIIVLSWNSMTGNLDAKVQ